MRLRTRLILLFSALAIVPLALVVPATVRSMRSTLEDELARRADSSAAITEALLAQRTAEIDRTLDELAGSLAVEEAARELHAHGMGPALAPLAARMMESRVLTVLSLLDVKGHTVSSGHLPARLLDVDPDLFALARRAERRAVPVMLDVSGDQGLRRVPAIVGARAVDYGQVRLYVVGGVLLDASLTDTIAQITGAQVELATTAGDASARSATSAPAVAGNPPSPAEVLARSGSVESPTLERIVAIDSIAAITVRLSRSALRRAESQLLAGVLLLAAGGLAFAVLLGVLASRRITRPVEALTAAARRLAAGDKDAKAEVRASGEVGELVQAFNGMSEELERTTARLLASERIAAWQEVARRLAHEIKNPLTPIKMSLETLSAAHREKSPQFDALFEESAGVVLEEVDRLRRIVDEFSRFARLPKPELTPQSLDAVVTNVLHLYASLPEAITLKESLEPGIELPLDRDQITQVLINLVKNAVEAMPQGGTLSVRTRTLNGTACIEVEDSGQGLSPELRERIFEPYVSNKEGGSGLGLALSARICQEHGGRLEVDSPPGRGATFRVVLPR